jgi:hypothetical protein
MGCNARKTNKEAKSMDSPHVKGEEVNLYNPS